MSTPKFKRIYIEISNICNLQCDFCPEVHREKKVMSVENFRAHLTQVAPLTEEVCLHLMGEPLAHPQFGEILGECAHAQVPVQLTTNGTLLMKRENSEQLLRPTVRQVNFSLQSFFANPQSQTLSDYLAPIFSWTRRAFIERPDLYVNYRLWNQGTVVEEKQKAEILEAVQKEFDVKLNPNVDVGLQKSKRVVGRLYLHFDSRFDWPSESKAEAITTGTCHGLRSHIGVHADGTVVPCCLDKEAALALGSLKEQSLTEILTGPRAQAMRTGFERGELVESMCQKCTYVRRFSKK